MNEIFVFTMLGEKKILALEEESVNKIKIEEAVLNRFSEGH